MNRLQPLIEEQLRAVNRPRPTLIFPEAEDPRILSAASSLTSVANIVMVTRRERALRIIEEQGVELQGSLRRFASNVSFVVPEDVPDLCEEFHEKFYEMSHGKRWAVPYDVAGRLVREPVMFSCMAVRMGCADSVLGGVVHASRDFFRPALRLLHTDKCAFELGMFSLPDTHPTGIYQKNLVAFADVAINVEPPAHSLASIAVGACKIVRDLIPPEVLPNVNGAILSYSTRGSAGGPSVERIRKAGELVPRLLERLRRENPLYESIHIEAELQISCAISIAAARSKLHDALNDPDSAVGRANVLVVSSLDSGNLLYHLYATRYPDADRLLMVGGMESRVLDFSRSSTTRDIVLGAMANTLRIVRRPDWNGTPRDRFFRRYRILVVNPGSTTTKLAAFHGMEKKFEEEVRHDQEALARCQTLYDQLPIRRKFVQEAIERHGLDLSALDAIVGRGGLVHPVVSGTYRVNDAMIEDLREARYGEHASNLGAPIARQLAGEHEIPAFIVDPVVVHELSPVSEILGVAGHRRRAIWHALSQKAAAKRYADSVLADYEDLCLVVAHMGGGITVGAHRAGRCFYVNDGLHEGPITAERAGSLPSNVIATLVYEEGLSRKELRRRLIGGGGLTALLGTSDLQEVEARMEQGDREAALAFEAMAQSIAAQIAGTVPRFEGDEIHRLILTGGMARSERLVARLGDLLRHLGLGTTVYPGVLEALALRDGAIRVLRGQEEVLEYAPEGSPLGEPSPAEQP